MTKRGPYGNVPFRQLERLFRKTGLTVHSQSLSDHVKHYKTALNAAHSSYISKTINTSNNKPKSLFSMVNWLVQPPIHNASLRESDELCCSFLCYFQGKLDALCETFGAELTTPTCELARPIQLLDSFSLTNPTLINEFILKSNSSSCHFDPAPTFLLKHCTSAISGSISHLEFHSKLLLSLLFLKSQLWTQLTMLIIVQSPTYHLSLKSWKRLSPLSCSHF